jgi:hypothetical protein
MSIGKVFIESYQSDDSEDESVNNLYSQSLDNYLRRKQNKIKMEKFFLRIEQIFFKKLSEYFNDIVGNILYKENDTNYIYDHFQDKNLDLNEQIRIVKIGILRSKLITLINIVKRRIKIYSIKFFDKMKLKIEMLKLFNKDDNYLYILPKPKLFRFRTAYAYRRLIYVIKKFRYRNNFLIRNSLIKWRDSIIDYIPDNLNGIYHYQKIKKFITIIKRIFICHEKRLIRKIIFNFLEFYKKNTKKEINTLLKKSFDFLYFLHNIFKDRKLRTFQKISNFNMIKNFTNIMRGYLIHNKFFYSNRNFMKKFYLWKHDTFFNRHNELIGLEDNRKKENVLIGLNIISYSVNFTCRTYLFKRKFFSRLIFITKFQNTLKEYSHKYKYVPKIININSIKESIYFMRKEFFKIFGLGRIITLIQNKKYKIFDSTKLKEIKFPNSVDNIYQPLILCFFRWKNIILQSSKSRAIKNILLIKLVNFINHKTYIQRINFAFQNIKIKYFYSSEKIRNLQTKILISNLQIISDKNKLILFNRMKYNHILQKYSDKNFAVKMILIYLKYSDNTRIVRGLKKYYSIWKLKMKRSKLANLNRLGVSMKKLMKIYLLYLKRNIKDLRFIFNKYKIITSIGNKKIFKKSNHRQLIDHILIQNHSKCLVELEKEDNKLKIKLLDFRNNFNNVCSILLRTIYNKQLKIFSYYFSHWRNKREGKQSLQQLCEISLTVRNQSESLMEVYRTKTNEYKKTIKDFLYLKEHFCSDCCGEEFEIDYKSVDLNYEESEANHDEPSIYDKQIIITQTIKRIF